MYIPISWRRLLLNKRHLLLNRRCLLLNRRRLHLNMFFNRTPASGIHLARALYLVRANLRQRIEKVMTFGTFIQRTGLIYGHSDFKSGHKSSKKSLHARKVNGMSQQAGIGTGTEQTRTGTEQAGAGTEQTRAGTEQAQSRHGVSTKQARSRLEYYEKSPGRHTKPAQSFRENKKVGKQMIA